MKSSQSKKLSFMVSFVLASLMFAEPAAAADIWERVKSITTGLSEVKPLLIYTFFLLGLGGIGWGGMEMYTKSQARGGDDVKWSGIGIKMIAGALLVSLTMTTDVMQGTVLGSSSTPPANKQ